MVHVFPTLKKTPAHPNRLNDQHNESSELSNVQRQSDDIFLPLYFPTPFIYRLVLYFDPG